MDRFRQIPLKIYLSLLIAGSLISSSLTELLTSNYPAVVALNVILILSAVLLYHITNKNQSGKALLMNRVATAAYIFLASVAISRPYIGKGSLIFLGLSLLLIVSACIYDMKTLRKVMDQEDE
ncbi:hypothetical protein CN918_30170 [Priestia megaterium]|nr:hypothetical protein CN918_30170 [Priestia megaterium]